MLRDADQRTLDELGRPYTVAVGGAFIELVISGFQLPANLQPTVVDLLLRLPPGFPDAAPDMFWLDPAATGPGGAGIPGTESSELYLGRTWQRWSRHIGGQWRPGIDNLATYMAYIRRCLDQAAGRAA